MIQTQPLLANIPAQTLDEWLHSPKLPVAIFKSNNVYELKHYLDYYKFELSEAVYEQPVLIYTDSNLHEIAVQLKVDKLTARPNSTLQTPVAKLTVDGRFNVTGVELLEPGLVNVTKNCNSVFLSAKAVEFRTKPIDFAKIMNLPSPRNEHYIVRVMTERQLYTLMSLYRLLVLLKLEAEKHSVHIEWQEVGAYRLAGKRNVAIGQEDWSCVKFDAELYVNERDSLLVGVIEVRLKDEPAEFMFTGCMGTESQYVGDHFHKLPFRFIVACNEDARNMFEDPTLQIKLDKLWRYLPATVFMSTSYITEPMSCASTSSAAKALSRQMQRIEASPPKQAQLNQVACKAIFKDKVAELSNNATTLFVPESASKFETLTDLMLLHNKEIRIGELASRLNLDTRRVLASLLEALGNLEILFPVRDCEFALAALCCACANQTLSAYPDAQLTGFMPFKTKERTAGSRHYIMVSYMLGEKEHASLYELKYLSSRLLATEPAQQDGSTKQAWKLAHVLTGELLQLDRTLLISNQYRTCAIRYDDSDQQLHLALNEMITIEDLHRLKL